jgi:hypothetical protein
MSTILYLFYDYFIIFPKNTAEGFIPFQSYYLVDEYLFIPTGTRPMCLNAHCKASTVSTFSTVTKGGFECSKSLNAQWRLHKTFYDISQNVLQLNPFLLISRSGPLVCSEYLGWRVKYCRNSREQLRSGAVSDPMGQEWFCLFLLWYCHKALDRAT